MDKTVLLKFIIPGHPPSVNSVWRNLGRGRFVKSAEYRAWESMVTKVCLTHPDRALAKTVKVVPYNLSIIVVSDNWFTKKGDKIRMPDTPNMIKAAEDAICSVFGWEDSFNISTTIRKGTESGSEDYTIVEFEFI